MTGGKIGILKGLLYILFQCLGGLSGAAILYGLLPQDLRGANGLGQTLIHSQLSQGNGVAIEMLITFVLVLVVFASAADPVNAPNIKGSAPLAIGLSITACHLWAVPLTGSSMNPARTLGPAVIVKNTGDLWVYWVGPLLGGFLAALVYQILLRARPAEEEGAKKKVPVSRKLSAYQKRTPPARNSVPEAELPKLVWVEGAGQPELDGKQ